MSIKLTYEFVKEYIEKDGYELLSKKYINARTKLLLKCPEDHNFEITFGHFKEGHRCKECFYKSKYISKEYIEKIVNDVKYYTLLDIKYNNKRYYISVKCPNNHNYETRLDSFVGGHRCPKCWQDKQRSNLNDYELYINKSTYKQIITCLTRKNYRKYKHLINPNNKPLGRGKYHIDHKYSIHQGFIDKIEPEIISSIYNLQILTEYDNISKHKKCSITKEELLKLTLDNIVVL